ncbi:TOG array regulator of axonemal microtubules protein 1-like isoform X2 [Petromyzon marinus]|uniref:TOG array regulator of axonemal microtubules protein 1-like isoform X2 n=1 Tax=Petromyzon marinus TaxID=7757 RepID=A0AAJ7SSX1_PETMA|nr:TOG array regulator of axonemal microtubules protein 1-like isoform X2 [Petromyzon marinus]
MEDPAVLEQLRRGSDSERAAALGRLRQGARLGGLAPGSSRVRASVYTTADAGGLASSSAPASAALSEQRAALFQALAALLSGGEAWRLRKECLELIGDVVPELGAQLERCMAVVTPRLVAQLGDPQAAVRKAALQALHVYGRHSRRRNDVVAALLEHGVRSRDGDVSAQALLLLPVLLTHDFAREDLCEVVRAAAEKLTPPCGGLEPEPQHDPAALKCLEHVWSLVGDAAFDGCLRRLPASLRAEVEKLLKRSRAASDHQGRGGGANSEVATAVAAGAASPREPGDGSSVVVASGLEDCEFGIVPRHVMHELVDETDYKRRVGAVDKLKEAIGRADGRTLTACNVLGLVGFLSNVLDDVHFKVSHGALELIGMLVGKLRSELGRYAQPVVAALVKVLGDGKEVTKQECLRIFLRLMETVPPQRVLDILLGALGSSRNARVREDILNTVIAAVLSFPRSRFNLPELCRVLAPSLADPKRKVRHAALETFAVLAALMGPGKLPPLVDAVDAVELSADVDGLMAAVQARLARRQLPKLGASGLVEYATHFTSSAGARGAREAAAHDADMEWILAGGSSSARSSRADGAEAELSARHQPPHHHHPPPAVEGTVPAGSRRVLSAGRPKSRLPWEEELIRSASVESIPQSNRLPGGSISIMRQDSRFAPECWSQGPMANPGEELPLPASVHGRQDFSSFTGLATHRPLAAIHKAGKFFNEELDSERGRGVETERPFFGKATNQWFTHQEPFASNLNKHSMLPKRATRAEHTAAAHSWAEGLSVVCHSATRDSVFVDVSHLLPTASAEQTHKGRFAYSWPSEHVEDFPRPRTKLPQSFTEELLMEEGIVSPVPTKATLARSASRRQPGHGRPMPPMEATMSPRVPFNDREHHGDVLAGGARDPFDRVVKRAQDHEKANKIHERKPSGILPYSETEEIQNSLRSLRSSAAKKHAQWLKDSNPPDGDASCGGASPRTVTPTNVSPNSEFGQERRVKASIGGNAPSSSAQQAFVTKSASKSTEEVSFITKPDPLLEAIPKGLPQTDRGVNAAGQQINSGGAYTEKGVKGVENIFAGSSQSKDTLPKTSRHKNQLQKASMDGATASEQQHCTKDVAVVGKGMLFGLVNDNTEFGNTSAEEEAKSSEAYIRNDHRKSMNGVNGKSIPHISHGASESGNTLSISLRSPMLDKIHLKHTEKDESSKAMLPQLVVRDPPSRENVNPHTHDNFKNLWQQLKSIDPGRVGIDDSSVSGLAVYGGVVSERLMNPTNIVQTRHSPVPEIKKRPGAAKTNLITPNLPAVHTIGQHKPVEKMKPHIETSRGQDSLHVSAEELASAQLKPSSNPEADIDQLLVLLSKDDWEKKMLGISYAQRLATFHPELLATRLHEVSFAVTKEAKNLRSTVARAAVSCISDMFVHLKKGMDQELDTVTQVLLHKSGETNNFMREDIVKALETMVANVTATRALTALINGGFAHRNIYVRKCTAQHLIPVVERLGAARLLAGIKDVTDRVLLAATAFAQDASPETRYYGKKMLFIMMGHPDFDKMIDKYVLPKDLHYVRDTVTTLRNKGLGESPPEISSAHGRRSLPGSGLGTRPAQDVRDGTNTRAREEVMPPREAPYRPLARSQSDYSERLKAVTGLLASKDFRERIKGIEMLVETCHANPDCVASNVVKFFDVFTPRLQESNSKVNQAALESLLLIIPALKDNLVQVVQSVVPAVVDNNLNSKLSGIYTAATSVIDTLMQHIDNIHLLQLFSNKAHFGSGRVKLDMTERLADLVETLYTKKPQAVERNVLPVFWHLLGNMTGTGMMSGGTGNIRASTVRLARSLHTAMGPGLITLASMQPAAIAKTLKELLGSP